MNLKRLEFTLTTKCNSQCIHCQANASPMRNDVMDVKDAYNFLAEATSVANLESLCFSEENPCYIQTEQQPYSEKPMN
jgi:molybdenum cofactor biosynthesis enzyme MoaA